MVAFAETRDFPAAEHGRTGAAESTDPAPSVPAIVVASFAGKGRGVRAVREIPEGVLIERCPVLIVPASDRAHFDRTILFGYVYMWEPGTREQELYSGEGRAAIALGLSSLLNHSPQPNAIFRRNFETSELDLISARAITLGEEITIDYQMDLWFAPA